MIDYRPEPAAFEQIEHRIGPSGRQVSIDASPRILKRAHVAQCGWDNVQLIETIAEQLSPSGLGELGVLAQGARFDAASAHWNSQ